MGSECDPLRNPPRRAGSNSMNARFTTLICAYVVLTGGIFALGAAFAPAGLIIAGAVLLVIAFQLFNQLRDYPKEEPRDRGKETPESW